MNNGWKGQSARHALAAKGVKTPRFVDCKLKKRSGQHKTKFWYEGNEMSRKELEDALIEDYKIDLQMWIDGEISHPIIDFAEEEDAEDVGWYGSKDYLERKEQVLAQYHALYEEEYGHPFKRGI